MAGKLTAAFVKSARHSGRTRRPEKHYDVHGLFLQVMPSGSKQFVQRLVVAGKRSDYGLGGYPIISLAEAREAAWENRRAARRGEVLQIEARRRVIVARRDVRLAFEPMVLTGVRSGEARLARWEEVDFEGRTWTIPAQRMKYTERGDHRVPLSARALGVMREAGAGGQGLVFRAPRGGALPEDAFRELLRLLGVQANPHGFRSSFRGWCAESGHPRELAEAALAHAVGDKVEAAYARTDLYERRRGVMEAWGGYVAG